LAYIVEGQENFIWGYDVEAWRKHTKWKS